MAFHYCFNCNFLGNLFLFVGGNGMFSGNYLFLPFAHSYIDYLAFPIDFRSFLYSR